MPGRLFFATARFEGEFSGEGNDTWDPGWNSGETNPLYGGGGGGGSSSGGGGGGSAGGYGGSAGNDAGGAYTNPWGGWGIGSSGGGSTDNPWGQSYYGPIAEPTPAPGPTTYDPGSGFWYQDLGQGPEVVGGYNPQNPSQPAAIDYGSGTPYPNWTPSQQFQFFNNDWYTPAGGTNPFSGLGNAGILGTQAYNYWFGPGGQGWESVGQGVGGAAPAAGWRNPWAGQGTAMTLGGPLAPRPIMGYNRRDEDTYTTANGPRTSAQMRNELLAVGWDQPTGQSVVDAYAQTTGAPVTVLSSPAAPAPTAPAAPAALPAWTAGPNVEVYYVDNGRVIEKRNDGTFSDTGLVSPLGNGAASMDPHTLTYGAVAAAQGGNAPNPPGVAPAPVAPAPTAPAAPAPGTTTTTTTTGGTQPGAPAGNQMVTIYNPLTGTTAQVPADQAQAALDAINAAAADAKLRADQANAIEREKLDIQRVANAAQAAYNQAMIETRNKELAQQAADQAAAREIQRQQLAMQSGQFAATLAANRAQQARQQALERERLNLQRRQLRGRGRYAQVTVR